MAAATADADRPAVLIDEAAVRSPIEGVVTARHADPGATLALGGPLATVADLDRRRVEAAVHDFDTDRVALDAPDRVHAEGYDPIGWPARVEEVPDRVIPVKVAFAAPTPLKLGRRGEVEIVVGPGCDAAKGLGNIAVSPPVIGPRAA